ncbi:MAG: 3-oxoacyl-[acyl-carrier-protein] synthase 3 [Alphaproteobacteria bacterium MarineAlpha6_Bin4]|nr:MAG: 3-oxoacyl-[acyl-carrier-protein] synthase 3 [Alphaproteobacteria bacterium MarineAlpha6_Bin3]PPR37807.1 MAG: 3-oxoacyl-[acyl-carrier-protein] synthase 3 [Alphaproteobacteria bacterium MarineAlpha6_Bin4]|tara:strand:- start:3174 stop:4163 length:990 start_codon:yes stop_codon:yes gene_type:complete
MQKKYSNKRIKFSSCILGCGSYLPKKIVTNNDLSKKIDTSDEWIKTRTGIKQRYIASKNQLNSDLGFQAARKAIKNSKIKISDIDLIIVATSTPDHTFPSTATKIQAKLGLKKGFAFDVQAACSGFIYAISIADNYISNKQAKNVLVIGSEIFSRILDWNDRSTCVLFGDGAGAIVLSDNKKKNSGIISTELYSDGRFYDLLYVNGGVSSNQKSGHVKMKGKEVFRHAVEKLSNCIELSLKKNNLVKDQIDWIIPHQANKRIMDMTANKLGIPREKILITIDRYANTSSASIPLTLDYALSKKIIKRGQIVVLEAIGGGLTWGCSILKY